MNEAQQLRSGLGASSEPLPPSSPAVLTAASKLYEAALAIRSTQGLQVTDFRDYLQPALEQLQREVIRATTVSKVAALERKPSVIQQGPDPAADLIRAANNGENVAFR